MPGPAHDQDRLPGLDEVVDDLDRAEDGAPDPAGQPDDLAVAVADRADPVERPLDAGAVVVAERADVLDDVARCRPRRSRARGGVTSPIGEARLRAAAEVDHDLDERRPVRRARGRPRRSRAAAPRAAASRSSIDSRCRSSDPTLASTSSGYRTRPARGPARRRGRGFPSSAA